MRITLLIEGERREVEVDRERSTLRLDGRELPWKVVRATPNRVELEIAGESVSVEGWPSGLAEPVGPISVNGELCQVRVEGRSGPAIPSAPMPRGSATAAPAVPAPPGTSPPPSVAGEATVAPPMPGKVVELRVREGETVAAGQVLLVLEAMKMRNEIAAPSAGTVSGLSVQVGSNVRARERMLGIRPVPT